LAVNGMLDPERTIAELKDLRRLTGDGEVSAVTQSAPPEVT
jgi:hypothetical protein